MWNKFINSLKDIYWVPTICYKDKWKHIHTKQITKDENASSLTCFSILPFLPRLILDSRFLLTKVFPVCPRFCRSVYIYNIYTIISCPTITNYLSCSFLMIFYGFWEKFKLIYPGYSACRLWLSFFFLFFFFFCLFPRTYCSLTTHGHCALFSVPRFYAIWLFLILYLEVFPLSFILLERTFFILWCK